MKILSDALHKAGILKEAEESYSSGGYSVLVRNNTTGRIQSVSAASFTNIYTADGTLTSNRTINTTNFYRLTINPLTTFGGTETSGGMLGIAHTFSPTLIASANLDTLVGVDFNPVFNTGAYTGVTRYGLRSRSIWVYHDSFNTVTTPTFYVGDNTFPIFSINPQNPNTQVFIRGNSLSFGSNKYATITAGDDITYDSGPSIANVHIKHNGTNAIVIDTNKNVGVGAAPGAYKLDVSGTGRFTGAISYNGNLVPLNTSAAYSIGISSTASGGIITAYANAGLSPLQKLEFGFSNTRLNNSSGISNPTHNNFSFNIYGTQLASGSGGGTYKDFSISTTYNFAGNANPATVYGISYEPTLTNMTNVTHVAFRNTVGNNEFNSTSGSTIVGGAVTDINASAALQVQSTSRGFLLPRMTGAQVEAIATPAAGLMAYATSPGSGAVTGSGWWGYNGSTWSTIGGVTTNLYTANGTLTGDRTIDTRNPVGGANYKLTIAYDTQGLSFHRQTLSSLPIFYAISGKDVPLTSGGSSTNYGVAFSANGNGLWLNAGQEMYFELAGSTKMKLPISGNLLVGTTDDSLNHKLRVQGTGYFSNNVTVIPVGGGTINLGAANTAFKVTDNGGYARIDVAQQGVSNNRTTIGGGNLGANSLRLDTTGAYFEYPANQSTVGTWTFSRPFNSGPAGGVATLVTITSTNNTVLSNATTLKALYINPNPQYWTRVIAIENTVGDVTLNTTSGNTIIGGSGTTSYKLDVLGSGRFTSTLLATDAFTLDSSAASDALQTFSLNGAAKWRIGNAYISGANYFQLYDSVNNLERIRWNNNSTATFTSDITFVGNSNSVANFTGVEPILRVQALGASNGVYFDLSPAAGYHAVIRNTAGSNIETHVGASPGAKHVVKSTGQIQFNGYTSTSSFSGTAAGYLGFDSSGNIITTSGVGGITLTTVGTSGAATWDGTTLNIPIYTGGGGGSVASVSVVTANGFAGSVANSTSTPAITISTTVNGIMKGNGTSVVAATANLDYQSPISLTTSGTSGAATFSSNTLNVPTYTLAGLGGVPTTRTITINGTAFDLSANRSWTIPSIYSADGTLAGNRTISSGGFTLTIQPVTTFQDQVFVEKSTNALFYSTFSNPNSGSAAMSEVRIVSDASAGYGFVRKQSSAAGSNAGGFSIGNATMGNIIINNSATSGNILFLTGGSTTVAMAVNSGNKVAIGSGTTGSSVLNISGLPTSSAGLSSGDVWRNGSVLTIVP